MQEGDTTELDIWLKETDTTVIAINRTLRPERGVQARAHGVEWSIDLGISDADFVQVIREADLDRVVGGDQLVAELA